MQPFWRITLLDSLTLSPVHEPNPANDKSGGTEPVRRFRSQKVASLLAYLALHAGRACPRDVLCEVLWPDGDPQETGNRLRVTLSSLRKQLEPPGVPKGAVLDVSVANVVRLRAESVWVDVAAFETALRHGNTQTAQTLFTGELLPTFYDDWILAERDRLNRLAQSLPAQNSPLSPFAAIQEETVSDAKLPPLHHLPLYLTRFFGRDAEKQRIGSLLAEEHCRLITLSGAGGQGKTRLGVEAARQQKQRPVWFVALADLWEAGRLPETIRDALGLPRSTAPALSQIVSFLQEQTTPLLFLDNVEQIAPAAAPLLTALLQQVPHLTLLVTSRVRLEIPGEQEIPVSPLPTPELPPPLADLSVIARLPSVALFVDRAQRVRPDFQITERNVSEIIGICQLLDGIPLGLELAAARCASLTPSQMRQKLVAHWDALPAMGRTDKTNRHRSLRAAIEWSVALLPADQRQLFTQLSVFQGGAPLEAIEAVCPSPHTLDTLTRLRANSLVLVTEQNNGFRYFLLEVLRQWASEQQGRAGRNALAEPHAAWFFGFATSRKAQFSQLSGVTALEEMEAEIGNFRAALSFFQTENPERFVDMVLALTAFWEHKSHFQEAQKYLEAALFFLPEGSEKRASVLLGLGTFAGRQGDGKGALTWLREARNAATPLPPTVQAAICWATGRAFWITGALNEALAEFEESRRLYQAQNDFAGLASAWSSIGITLRDQGDYDGARTAFTEAMQLAREHDAPRTLATVLDNFASLRHILGEKGVRELYMESLALKRALQMPDGMAVTLSNLALLHCRKEEWAEGRRLSEEVCSLFRALGNRRGLAISINRLGQIADAEGKHDEAKRFFIESLTLRLALGNPHGIIIALISFSEHALSVKRPQKAAQILGVVQNQLEAWGTPLPVDEDAEYRQHRALVQAALSPAAWKKAVTEGASWTQADLIQKLQK